MVFSVIFFEDVLEIRPLEILRDLSLTHVDMHTALKAMITVNHHFVFFFFFNYFQAGASSSQPAFVQMPGEFTSSGTIR